MQAQHYSATASARSLSTVLVQDHFYSDFCSLSSTIYPQTQPMWMTCQCASWNALCFGQVDEQHARWRAEWVIYCVAPLLVVSILPAFSTCVRKTHCRTYGRLTADMSLFQPKTATIKHIAIALMKISFIAVLRKYQASRDAIKNHRIALPLLHSKTHNRKNLVFISGGCPDLSFRFILL